MNASSTSLHPCEPIYLIHPILSVPFFVSIVSRIQVMIFCRTGNAQRIWYSRTVVILASRPILPFAPNGSCANLPSMGATCRANTAAHCNSAWLHRPFCSPRKVGILQEMRIPGVYVWILQASFLQWEHVNRASSSLQTAAFPCFQKQAITARLFGRAAYRSLFWNF